MSAVKLMPPAGGPSIGGVWYASTAAEKSKLIYTGPARIHAFVVENKSTGTLYAWVYDGTSSSGTLIHPPVPITSHSAGGFDWRYGIDLQVGLYVGISASDSAFSADTNNDVWLGVGYVVTPPKR